MGPLAPHEVDAGDLAERQGAVEQAVTEQSDLVVPYLRGLAQGARLIGYTQITSTVRRRGVQEELERPVPRLAGR